MTKILNFYDYKNKYKNKEKVFNLIDLGLIIGKYRLYAQELTPDDTDVPEYKEVIRTGDGDIEQLVSFLDIALKSIGSKDCTVDDDPGA